MLSLFSEIIVSIIGVSFLGLFAGLMIQKSLGKRKLAGTVASWEDRLKQAEDDAKRDSEHLEDQLQSLSSEVKTLTERNRSLQDTLQENETVVHQTRTDAMELNRQQAETQERLQRIIQQKELEISELGDSVNDNKSVVTAAIGGATASVTAGSVINKALAADKEQAIMDDTSVTETEDSLTVNVEDQTEALDNTIPQQVDANSEQNETVAFAPTMVDTLDETARIGTTSPGREENGSLDDPYDVTMDATAEMADNSLNLEEATIVLDDEALSMARKAPRDND